MLKYTLDKINLSFDAPRGSLIVYFIVWKNNTDMISAMEQHDVGCLKKRKEQKFFNRIPAMEQQGQQTNTII